MVVDTRMWEKGGYTCAVFMKQEQLQNSSQQEDNVYARRARRWGYIGAVASSSTMILIPLVGITASAPEVFAAVVVPLTIAGISLRRMFRNLDLAYEMTREEVGRPEPKIELQYEEAKKSEPTIEPQYEEIKPFYPIVPHIVE